MNFQEMRVEPAANGIIVHVGGPGKITCCSVYVFNTEDDFFEWFKKHINGEVGL